MAEKQEPKPYQQQVYDSTFKTLLEDQADQMISMNSEYYKPGGSIWTHWTFGGKIMCKKATGTPWRWKNLQALE